MAKDEKGKSFSQNKDVHIEMSVVSTNEYIH
jgi:hypothetical protein